MGRLLSARRLVGWAVLALFFIDTAAVAKTPGWKRKGARMTAAEKKEQAHLEWMLSRLAPVELTADISTLSLGNKKALSKILAAARQMDPIYLRQVWVGNPALQTKLEADTTPLGKLRLEYFRLNAGPWSRLDHDEPFLPEVPKKPLGAAFYPEDLTKAEFESWVKSLSPKGREMATGFFSILRRGEGGRLETIAYHEAYREFLVPAAKLLGEAAALTSNASLAKYLRGRAAAFLSDDYYPSDIAWMELDAPLEITIGPYETYEDGLFNYKACYEAYVTLRDDKESARLARFSGYLQEIEDHLPLDPKYRNPKLGSIAPIRVVDQLFTSGEGNRGVLTAAFNLPNDERVIKEKGSKRVMLKNVQRAKFEKVLLPIAGRVMDPAQRAEVAFEPFFIHILMHELMHGLGPHEIKVGARQTSARMELKELHAAIEEAKADITGLFAMRYLMDKGVIDKRMHTSMYTTYLASAFRSVRFGINEAHGKGVAMQFNYLTDEGAIVETPSGHFRIVEQKMPAAVEKLTRELLTIEAEGSYPKAQQILGRYGVIRPAMERALRKLDGIPIDVRAIYPVAAMEFANP